MERVGSPRRRARLVCGAVAVALGLDVGGGAVWVAGGHRLVRVAATSGARTRADRVAGQVDQVAVGAGAVWAIDEIAARLWRIDPRAHGLATSTRPSLQRPTAIDAGHGAAWVTAYGPPRAGRPAWDRAAGFLLRIGPRTGRATDRIGVGRFPSDIALTGSAAWVANARDGTVQKVSQRGHPAALRRRARERRDRRAHVRRGLARAAGGTHDRPARAMTARG